MIVTVVGILIVLLIILTLYCCIAINGKHNKNGIHRFDDMTIGECDIAYKHRGFVTSIANGRITGFELERE